MSFTSRLEDNPLEETSEKWPANIMQLAFAELKTQRRIVLPLAAMNLTWFVKLVITTAFLGRLGELQLAGGTLALTFANVTGFSVLNGLCGAMEPICGQAYGAKNYKLLHKTLIMSISLLLITCIPISFLWLNVDGILIYFGQKEDISKTAKNYLFYLFPDLLVTSFLCPLKSYLYSQSIAVPIMFSSALAVALHFPINILLSRSLGLVGVSLAVWLTDLVVVILLSFYLVMVEYGKGGTWKEGGWWDQGTKDWVRLLKLSGPCCLTTCLEWWCLEILVLLTGWLANAKQAVGVLAILLNFDYLLYSVMLSIATCASIRVSNELGANQSGPAYSAAYVSLALCVISGFIGGLITLAIRGAWGPLFSQDKGILRSVKKTMLLMALIELVNFPVVVCGGIVRGTARPWLAMYANLGGFYLLALPLCVVLAFKVHLGVTGLLGGYFVGMVACLGLLFVFIGRIDWDEEACKAQILASHVNQMVVEDIICDKPNHENAITASSHEVDKAKRSTYDCTKNKHGT